ncbi:sialate O-acetylesterase [Allofournierella sp.]|uniref:sialate O-acetylesterase n=1 Tax=Allofournierella sp. TaxID=1940256 RepID=UPI003AB2A344
MNFGVTITKGAVPWQIFQQGADGTAAIRLEGAYHLVHLSQELPLQFEQVDARPAVVKARVALESTGESVIPWTVCEVPDGEHWSVCFDRVPAGGLYRIETYMEYEGWDGLSCTRGDMVHNIGVGDVFVIAGQSNAAGRAKNPVADDPELGVHVLRASARWELATHPLGETTGAVHLGHYENHNPGHSPWLHFAKRLKRELGYPIGLVPCAYGGAPLRWWNPEENGALFANMLEMLADYELHPRAVLWYQGEAEGYEGSAGTYLERFTALVRRTREALAQPELPFITVQLNRSLEPAFEARDRQWGMVREAQRQAAHVLDRVTVVPAADQALYDSIHNASQSNLVIGERCALAALAVCYGRDTDWRAPEPETVVQTAPDMIEVHFSRIRNWINAFEVPPALLPFEAEDDAGLAAPAAYTVSRDGLAITFERPLAGKVRLHGAWRMNPGIAVPCDCMRIAMLSFYGVPARQAPNAGTATQ